MFELVHHLALLLALLALGHASLRIASVMAPTGLERLIAAVVIGVTLAIAEAMALGVVSLGASPVALTLAAIGSWAAALSLTPAMRMAPLAELSAWWRNLGTGGRVAAAALGGLAGAWVAWQVRNFSIGFDSSLYHYPLVAGWIANGSPGTGLELSYEIPYGAYPLTDEVALTWGAAIARGWTPLVLWNPLLGVLLALAGWLTLRNLSVSRGVSALAVAALVTAPLIVRQLNEPQTDLPALAWLACVAALATSAGRRPGLLVPALLAAGLAIGTKPSMGPLAVAALGVGAVLARGRLRPLAPWLAGGLAGAFVVGGIWYADNIVEYGSPLWPFAPGPFGDPSPRLLGLVDATFLERPGETLEGRLDEYSERLGGTWVLLLGSLAALLAGILGLRSARPARRVLIVSGAVALGGLAIWSSAWGTGLPTSPELRFAEGFPISALRYMLAPIGAATVAVAVLTRAGGAVGTLAGAALAVALALNLVNDAQLGTPWTPPAGTLALGALAGLALLGLAAALRSSLGGAVPAPMAAALAALGVTVALALNADGYVERWTKVENSSAYGPELARGVAELGLNDGDGPIAFASHGVLAQLAGDRLEHELVLVPRRAACAEVYRQATRMPVVVTDPLFFKGTLGLGSYSAPRCLAGRDPVLDREPFFVYRLGREASSGTRPPAGDRRAQLSERVRAAATVSEPVSAPITRTSGSGTMKLPPPSRYARSRSRNSSRKCQGSTR